jgi:hypothetical protein
MAFHTASRRRTVRTGAATIVAGLLVAATGCARSSDPGASSTPSPTASPSVQPSGTEPGACSAAGLSADLPRQSLPEPVASMRSRIAEAATACDYDELDRLALASKDGFSFSFGGQKGKPSGHWRRLESEGRAPLAYLVKVLSVSPGSTELPPSSPEPGETPGAARTIHVWPTAATKDVPSESDWAELEKVYPREQVAKMKEDTARFGIGYLGWRAGITAPGEWIYFIEGD